MISITASDRDPERAADIANAVADALLAVQSDLEKRRSSDSVRRSLNDRNEREWSIRMMSQFLVIQMLLECRSML